ncbi:hypothetical protein AVEN_260099-1 [Araneus ventricosus]|uniref:Uncharacterized protein n=1 Tax=Araneus ventricosus TaxID=182803 RepID=A0A4Y2N6W7_ARAVE|nr:hypothetical protein AVEN_260099-1 [Araneus ventricosus]
MIGIQSRVNPSRSKINLSCSLHAIELNLKLSQKQGPAPAVRGLSALDDVRQWHSPYTSEFFFTSSDRSLGYYSCLTLWISPRLQVYN